MQWQCKREQSKACFSYAECSLSSLLQRYNILKCHFIDSARCFYILLDSPRFLGFS